METISDIFNGKAIYSQLTDRLVNFGERQDLTGGIALEELSDEIASVLPYSNGFNLFDVYEDGKVYEFDVEKMYCMTKAGERLLLDDVYIDYGAYIGDANFIPKVKELLKDRECEPQEKPSSDIALCNSGLAVKENKADNGNGLMENEDCQIKNIVFDMGGVLTVFDEKEYIYGYVDNEEDYRIMRNEVCRSVEWLRMDRGTLTDEEAIESICARVPKRLHNTVGKYIREYRRDIPPNEKMEELVKELKERGYRLYLFSNTSHRFRNFSRQIKSLEYMDGIWISCEQGVIKPQTQAYDSFFGKFGLNPYECIFIDDMPANIEAGMCAGMKGIVYNGDIDELRQRMDVQLGR